MSLGVHVNGGTGAGWRRIAERKPWQCGCYLIVVGSTAQPIVHPGTKYSCEHCGARRDSLKT